MRIGGNVGFVGIMILQRILLISGFEMSITICADRFMRQ